MAIYAKPYVLGLDLGVQSVGWSAIEIDGDGHPCGVLASGVRCFDSGVGSESQFASGKDESQNIKRRQARQQRRQLWRRGRRLKKIFGQLQKAGLLPPDAARTPEQRHEIIKKLDIELAEQYLPQHDRVAGHLLPYRLRALALDKPLPPFALGRALFHLAQRRGFETNSRSALKDEEEAGVVKKGISELSKKIQESNARTLGEYFAGLDPEDERIRQRWTARQMYLDEFEAIWAVQTASNPALNEELKNNIHDAIFRQRPLKSQKHLIGQCELEPTHRRAPAACLEAQRFRYLQKVNDLEIIAPDAEIICLNEPQHSEMRAKVIALLDSQSELTFRGMLAKLGLKKPKGAEVGYKVNLEEGGESKLKGNSTAVKLINILEAEYDRFSLDELSCIVDDLLEYEKHDALVRRLVNRYGIPTDKAEALSNITLERGYLSLSRKALAKLLPVMEQGCRYATARKKVYGDVSGISVRHDVLPPVLDAVVELRNPVVCRGLTELRKVVNAVIRKYGKPDMIRIELARDLKKSRKQREELTKKNRDNEKSRDDARKKVAERLNCDKDAVSNLDILKVRLAEECNWECPYTGKTISMDNLVGKDSHFDIEHIIPFSRSLDNSFVNKTLCDHKENRVMKRNQIPYEIYAANEARWSEILGRVSRFRGPMATAKLQKFKQREISDEWATRMLQDTRYMSRLATDYLGLLYGGQIDADHRRRIQVTPGRMTAFLRDDWGLNAILADGDEDEKNREDHRHHAVDAMVVALTDAKTVAMLSRSAESAAERGHRLFALDKIEKPWPTFLEDVRRSIDAINISYRVNRRVKGALHEETNYSKAHTVQNDNGKTSEVRHVRKPLQNMSANEVNNIVDNRIRELVLEKLERLGGDPKKAFADHANHPYLTAGDGRKIFIHKARIRKNVAVIPLGKSTFPRYAAPGSNHHMEIFAVLDKDGKEKTWNSEIVSLIEASKRIYEKKPLYNREHGQNTKFKFSLTGGEYVEMEYANNPKNIYRVTVISGNQIEFRLHTDARPITILKKAPGARVRCSPSALQKAKARKVVVDPLGNILPAND